MTREERLRNIILDRYISMRQFAMVADIPYSTLLTGLQNGITGMSFDTVIRICKVLGLNPLDL